MTPNPNPSPEALAVEISRIAGCQVGSDRTKRLVDFIIARDAALSPQTLPAPGEVQGVGVTGPCANCGNEGSSVKGPDKLHPYRVICKSCGASTAHHASWRASNDAWNRRPTLATVAAANDEGVAEVFEAAAKVADEEASRLRAKMVGRSWLDEIAEGMAKTADTIAAAIRLLSQGGGKA